MRRNFLKNENANFSFFVVFVILSVMTIFFFAFASPFLIQFLSYTYNAGQDILSDTESQIEEIQDNETRETLQESLESAQESTSSQIDILSNFYKYSWAFIIIVISLVIFVIARSWVEYERRGGLV